MRSLLAAVAFLTRFPVGRSVPFEAADVSRSAGWFPLIGLLLGGLSIAAAALLKRHLPPIVIAALLLLLDAVLTGALHFDGLADTADGFGGGKGREQVLAIMRDHSIGSYGALALALVVGLKLTAYATLLKQSDWLPALLLTPALGRWSALLLTSTLPYARPSASVAGSMGKQALLWGTATILLTVLALRSIRAWIAMAVVIAVTAVFGLYCRQRIAGITGDVLGANLQLCESAALLTFIWV